MLTDLKTIKTTTLANGARIVTEVVDHVYSASIGVWVDVGSQDETVENNGVSHCLEHMLFKATTTRSAQDIAQQIEDVGGSLGASTGKENTCFYGRVLGDQLPVAIDLLFDMLLNSTLSDDDLDLERQVILEEIKMYDDDPEDFGHETLILNIWPNHPLSRPITGTLESVEGITSKMLRQHVDRYYSPERLVVSIAGNFDEHRAIEQISNLLAGKTRGQYERQIPPTAVNKINCLRYKEIEQAHVSIATRGLDITHEDKYVAAILDLCMGGNVSSRLFQEVREKRGLVYTINTFRESHSAGGLFGVYAGASPKHVKKVLDLVSKEFKRTKKEGFTAEEIERAKTQLRSELLLGLESMRSRGSRNAYSELYFRRQLTVEEIVKEIDLVSDEQVRSLAKQLLVPEDLSLVVVGPQDELQTSYEISC
ncbi:MAG TPA: pitrilysin family protein [Planktothrix sp.]